jgi:Fe-S cluster assembly protein SufD
MKNNFEIIKKQLIELYHTLYDSLQSEPVFVKEQRETALGKFIEMGFPSSVLEYWKGTDLQKLLKSQYIYNQNLILDKGIDLSKVFQCEIHNFETLFFANYNGHNLYESSALTTLDNGVIAGSIRQAMVEYPELMQQYWNQNKVADYNGLTAINTAVANDGLFIFVPQNVRFDTPMQLVNIISHPDELFVQTRNIIILEKNSSLTFLQCDDSLVDNGSFKNSVSEFYIAEGAKLDHYKLQNKDLSSVMVNTSFFNIESGGVLNSNIITFNAGSIRNELIVNLNGKGASADLSGLYLIDKTQHVDNQLFVRHNAKECFSRQTFKGILDDEAASVFTGHIYVAEGAMKTEAYQSNRNILLTDTASVMSKPFLEIYNDDVRCSHGSTTGQIDRDAMFYLQQRGICEKNARLLMMYAFADEVVRKIQVERLQTRTENMVHKRLKGELSSCDQCILHCNPDHIAPYKIDESLIN